MNKLYAPVEAKKIKERIKRARIRAFNSKSIARQKIEELNFQKELRELQSLEQEWIDD